MDNQENNGFIHDDLPAFVEIIGISFRGSTKIYYFAANGARAKEGDNAIVETARGLEYGKVTLTNTEVKREELVLPLKNVVRIADKNDDMRYEANREKEKEAFDICLGKIADHGLDMKLIDVEYTFDNSKLLFYFTSDDRVDFRELVKDLAGYFRTRIELRQIGIRDEAKIMGGLGICGRPFCCNTFLPDFVQVSIKMAKEQNLSLNSAKISGACGRLMCCLRYEYDTYQEELRRMPKVDTVVVTPDGIGKVTELKPLENTVKVLLDNENEKAPKLYHLSVLKPFDKNTVSASTNDRSRDIEAAKESGVERSKSGTRASRDNERRKDDSQKQNKAEFVEKKTILRDESETDAKSEPNKKNGKDHHRSKNHKGKNGKGDPSSKDVSENEIMPVDHKNENEVSPRNENDKNDQSAGGQNRNGNRNRRNRHRHGGSDRNSSEKQSQHNSQNHSDQQRKEQMKSVGAESLQTQPKVVSEQKDGTEKGKKTFAPLPSNSIKKNNKRKF